MDETARKIVGSIQMPEERHSHQGEFARDEGVQNQSLQHRLMVGTSYAVTKYCFFLIHSPNEIYENV